jgi:hypothetical protein
MKIPLKRLTFPKDLAIQIGGGYKSSVNVGTTQNDAKSIYLDTDLGAFVVVPVRSHPKHGEAIIISQGAAGCDLADLAPAAPAPVKPSGK